MNEHWQRQIDSVTQNIEARPQSEKAIILATLAAALLLTYISLLFDPVRADVSAAKRSIAGAKQQIQAQQSAYASMLVSSQQDPDKFANDRLAVILQEQTQLDQDIADLAGDFVSPSEMTRILTSVLEQQTGLKLMHFRNEAATPLRVGIASAATTLRETGRVNFDELAEDELESQVYEHGLVIEFQGGYFDTVKYLRFLEEITGSFFWDGIDFKQTEWPNAAITLEIHTLSMDEGFLGV